MSWGQRVAVDGPARVHDEGAHAIRALTERPVFSPAAVLMRAKLLVYRVRDVDAGFDVIDEHVLGQVKGKRRHFAPLEEDKLRRLLSGEYEPLVVGVTKEKVRIFSTLKKKKTC